MSIKTKGVKKHKESILALSAYESYKTTRDIEQAYNLYMQENVSALTTIGKFVHWASEHSWQSRVNEFDAEEELRITQSTRRAALQNSLSAEEMCAELVETCREEMELKRGDMNHSDIARYMTIAVKINERWAKGESPQVVVNTGNDLWIDIPEDVLREAGKKITAEDDK